jgi:hypothetical protein
VPKKFPKRREEPEDVEETEKSEKEEQEEEGTGEEEDVIPDGSKPTWDENQGN